MMMWSNPTRTDDFSLEIVMYGEKAMSEVRPHMPVGARVDALCGS